MSHLRIVLVAIAISIGMGHYLSRQPAFIHGTAQNCVVEVVSYKRSLLGLVSDGGGSGVFITRNGVVLTAAHVVDQSPVASVYLPNGTVKRYVRVAFNRGNDLAILVPVKPVKTPFVELGAVPAIGDKVYAMAFPSGAGKSFTTGHIAAFKEWLITTVPIAHGSSGGALLNSTGGLVSLISGFYDANDTNSWQGFTFSPPYETLKDFLEKYEPVYQR